MTCDDGMIHGRRSSGPHASSERDQAVAEVLDEIRSRLHTVYATKGGVQQDLAHAVAEHFAAPYALTLFYEIERLDAELARARATAATS